MKRGLFLLGCFSLGVVTGGKSVQAQAVVSDGSLNTIVTRAGNNFAIDSGTPTGPNLFHSFREFSIPTGGSAVFNNAPTVQNIFSRVTGGTVSSIDGLIQTQGMANLFLLNPAGIVLGAKASLDIGGSFVGTTAQKIQFADGIEFGVVKLNDRPLLTISAPVGLQMGQDPGSITNNGAQLTLPAGKTLGLVGGAITQVGGALTVPGGKGRIELIALGNNSQAKLQVEPGGWLIDPTGAAQFQNITLRDGAKLLGHGFNSSSIRIIGDTILGQNDARFNSFNTGDQTGGDVTITGATAIRMLTASTDVSTKASGNTGNIKLSAPRIEFKDGGGFGILVETDATGNAGDAIVTADIFQVTDSSGYSNVTLGYGDSGDITIRARQKMLVSTYSGGGPSTDGEGNAGNLNLFVGDLTVANSSGFETGSYQHRYVEEGKPRRPTTGNGGDINIVANSIVLDTAGINSDTQTSGEGGNITITTKQLELNEAHISARSSGPGKAGVISINADTIRLVSGGQISTSTSETGNAGEINVSANSIELDGGSAPEALTFASTGIFSSILPNFNDLPVTGNGGDINVTSSSLVLREGAIISASTTAGTGTGGDIDLRVDRLEALSGGQIMNVASAAGNAGTINIDARDSISLSGQDAIHSDRQRALDPKKLTNNWDDYRYWSIEYNVSPFTGIYGTATTSSTGRGSSVKINVGALQVTDNARISVSSQGVGDAGNLSVKANQLRLDQQGSLQAESIAGKQGNIGLTLSEALLLRHGSTITTNALQKANGGNITINSPIIFGLDNSDIIANAEAGIGGGIELTTQSIIGLALRNTRTPRTDLTNDITASSGIGLDGKVQLNTIGVEPHSALIALPVGVSDSSQKIAKGCQDNQASQFIATGRGGIPMSPLYQLAHDSTWIDLRKASQRQTHAIAPSIQTPILAEVTTPVALNFCGVSGSEIQAVREK